MDLAYAVHGRIINLYYTYLLYLAGLCKTKRGLSVHIVVIKHWLSITDHTTALSMQSLRNSFSIHFRSLDVGISTSSTQRRAAYLCIVLSVVITTG